ncbi:MAG: hypothetical protein GY838_02445 [bacterium]|nr:hypothetical protein [bacterium]
MSAGRSLVDATRPGEFLVRLWRHRRIRYATFMGVWVLVFFLGAWPAWQASYRNEKRISEATGRIEALTSMAAAGAWFNAAAASWQPVQEREYERRFPRQKGREQLFLELARVASAADIDPFGLREMAVPASLLAEEPVDELAVAGDEDQLSQLVEHFAADTRDLPATELHTYRLLATFNTDYGRLASFFAGLEDIERALTVHALTAVPSATGINVALELDFYVQSAR